MKPNAMWLLAVGAFCWSAPTVAQQPEISQSISGTRLDVVATGEATRVPDVAVITAGVVTRAASASAALAEASSKMQRVLDRLKQAGIASRDIQTSNISLNPEYHYADNQPPQLTGYSASNQLTVRFHDIQQSGRILDSLVSEGANQISGPELVVDQPDQALDEARAKAVAIGRARAELYARSLGLHVARIVSVVETGGYSAPPAPVPMMARMEGASTKIEAGEQKLQVSLTMTFELQ